MNQRKKTSGGQAIVMISVALLSMSGMMGLAVDLGWSYYVQKTAQTSADGAALAAVQETYRRNGGGLGTLTCGATADCQTHQPCSTFISSSSNLGNGCLYAQINGFASGGMGGRQEVWMTSGVSTPPPTVPGVTDVKYWVTVQTVQTIPQLFSAVLGNTQGTVAAIATAAIAGSITPGSFYGLNQAGDCLTGVVDTIQSPFNCGVDVDLASSGSANCLNADGSSSGASAKLCAPAGIFLASRCNGSSKVGCGSGSPTDSGTNWAGQTSGAADAWAQSGTQINGDGNVNDPGDWLPAGSVTRNSSADFSDPTKNLKQPPLINASQPTCAVPNGIFPDGMTLGPYQYYATNPATGLATGLPLKIGNNSVVTFDPTGSTCPGTASDSPTTGTFTTFTFWGGMDINGNASTTVNFGAGQYVMAGTSSQTGKVLNVDGNGDLNGDSSLGTQFLFTDGSYSSQGTSLTMPTALTARGYNPSSNWYQGFTDIKNARGTLTGPTSSAPLRDYQNFLFWNDRRNSNMQIDPDTSAFVSRTRPTTTTDTSPQFVLEHGGMALNLKGVVYQPRGAWTTLQAGGSAAVGNAHLMLVTGALLCNSGCGSATITLMGPTAPIIRYITSLIQ